MPLTRQKVVSTLHIDPIRSLIRQKKSQQEFQIRVYKQIFPFLKNIFPSNNLNGNSNFLFTCFAFNDITTIWGKIVGDVKDKFMCVYQGSIDLV